MAETVAEYEERVIAIGELTCDERALFKRDFNRTKVFEIELRDLNKLEFKSSFVIGRALYALVILAAAVFAYLQIETEWLKWTLAIVLGLHGLGKMRTLSDVYLEASTANGSFPVDVEDIYGRSDIETFAHAVMLRAQRARVEGAH